MKDRAFKKYSVFLLLFSFGMILSGIPACKKETQAVPNVSVNISLYAADPTFVPLNAVNGWLYVNGGNRGILVFRKSLSEFIAFDRTCTNNPANVNEFVKVDASNINAACSNCGSTYSMFDGTKGTGPAPYPLKIYQNTFDGTVLHIFN